MVLAIDDVEISVRAAQTARRHFPRLKLFARARNRQHAYRLMDLGIQLVWRETLLSSLDMTRAVLRGIGMSGDESDRAVERLGLHDENLLHAHHDVRGDPENWPIFPSRRPRNSRSPWGRMRLRAPAHKYNRHTQVFGLHRTHLDADGGVGNVCCSGANVYRRHGGHRQR